MLNQTLQMLWLDQKRVFAMVNHRSLIKSIIDFGQWPKSHVIFKRQAKALIRLRICAGWSEPLLVALTTLLESTCCGSYY